MITSAGKNFVGNSLVNSLPGHIVAGCGNSAPDAANVVLDFEVVRVPVRYSNYDAATGLIHFIGTVPDTFTGYISEVGLVSSASTVSNAGVLASFIQDIEPWSGGTWTSQNSRVGGSALQLSGAAATLPDLSGLPTTKISDMLKVAYFGAGGTVEVRIENSSTDYYSTSFTAKAGYNVHTVVLSDMAETGSPFINSATSLNIIHSGTGNVQMDAIRVTPADQTEFLVVRQLLNPGFNKVAGMPLDIEVTMGVGV